MSHQTADAVVIGAGVIGSSVARSLAADGHQVVVVDRGGAPGQGSTSASSAIVRFNYSTFAGVALAWEAHYSWLDWESFLGGADDGGQVARFWTTGSLCLDSPAMPSSQVLGLFDEVGVAYDVLTADDIRSRFPALDPARHHPPKPVTSDEFWQEPDGELGGFFTPDAGFVDDPSFAAHNLATSAIRHGADFRFRTTVAAITRSHGRVDGVQLTDGSRIDAPVVVNVAGPASARINALAGVDDDFAVRTAPLRVEVHTVPAPSSYGVPGSPGVVVADLDLGTYVRGTPSGEVTVGGTEPACDPLHWVDDPDDFRQTVTQTEYEAQLYRAARRMPDLAVPNAPRGIAGLYDVADDWVPIYDKTNLPGFYVAIGTSGNQFKNAPVVGSALAAIIDACENGRDHDVDPVTLHLPRSGVDVDLSAYSRRRDPTSSSNSVMG